MKQNIYILDKTIINPMIEAMGIENEDKIKLKKVLSNLIFKEMLLKILKILPEEQIKKMEQMSQKIEFLKNNIDRNSKEPWFFMHI